jgi:hypothetical protein
MQLPFDPQNRDSVNQSRLKIGLPELTKEQYEKWQDRHRCYLARYFPDDLPVNPQLVLAAAE